MPNLLTAEAQLRSALLGLAIGDALGVPVEFKSRATIQQDPVQNMRGFGTHHQPAGTWSDDASLTFCLAESIASGYSRYGLAANLLRWYRQAWWTAHNEVFDVGVTTRQALQRLERGVEPTNAGGQDSMSNGNGALMRILPLAFYQEQEPARKRFALLQEVSALTHGHIRSAVACWLYLEMARYLRDGHPPLAAYELLCAAAPAQFKELAVPDEEVPHFDRILSGQLPALPESAIQNSGYVLHTLEAAFWCLLQNDAYVSTVLAAVNLGEDTDTTGAVAGGLAGLYYGEGAIPAAWREVVARRQDIEELAQRMNAATLPRPIPNSYWATPDVLGCEYPGDKHRDKAQAKLLALLDAGITDFYDLTESHELLPYEPQLRALAAERGVVVHYQRYPIQDVSVPDPATLEAVLAALMATQVAGRKAAVHCWGGIGRTATVVGCYLVRVQQLSGQAALARIAHEWLGVEKSARRPQSPETAAQLQLVETFR